MTILLFAAIIFLSLIQWMVIIDVLLSWPSIVKIYFRPVWIQRITNPLYESIRRILPTSVGWMDFTPIIVFILIELITNTILQIDPTILSVLSR